MGRVIITSLLVFITMSLSVFSIVPRQISWQGLLTDDNGVPLNGIHTITMRLYLSNNPSDNTPIWAETVNANIEDGLANITMGEIIPLPEFDIQYWLEILIDSGPALPRVKLSSVPYSLMSKEVEDNSISTEKIQTFAVTNDKIASLEWSKITNAPLSYPPVGAAGGDLNGHYPNPSIKDSSIISSKLANSSVVRSLNNLTDKLNLVAGPNIVIMENVPNENDITIKAQMSGPAGGDLTGSYPNPQIAPLAVTTDKIANRAVTTAKIAVQAVTDIELANDAVTAEKIRNEAVTPAAIMDYTVVRSLNNFTDYVELLAGANIKIEADNEKNGIKITGMMPEVIVLQDDDGNKTEISAGKIKQTKSGSISTTIIQLGNGFYADEDGNTTTINSRGTIISDDEGNETTSTARGTTIKDEDGNET